MYTIIGGDGKEYGPISAEDMRKWISEGRLNAQSSAKAENDAAFRTLSTFPEFADIFGPHVPAPEVAPGDWAERDYELDIGACVSRGWNLFKSDMGTLFVVFLLGMVIIFAASAIIGVIMAKSVPTELQRTEGFEIGSGTMIQVILGLVNGPLLGGIFYVFIQRMRGRAAGVGEMFVGFQRAFSQLFLGNFVAVFLATLSMIPAKIIYFGRVVPLFYQMQGAPAEAHQTMSQVWPALAGVLPYALIGIIPAVYLTVSWQFTLPLIIDKQMDFWDAMKMSFKKVHKHWFHVFGFTVVAGLINLAGVCVCCIGLLFTAPIAIAATMYVYETIFGESRAA